MNVIEIDGLTYTYPDTKAPAVDDISFSIREGQVFGFLGPSGAGKSTTQKILTKLLTGYQGSAKIFGAELSAMGDGYFEKIGVGFELPNHYLKLTGLENLNFFREMYSGSTLDPMTLLERVGLAEDAGKRVGDYSKGMKMRLNFIRALLNQPEVLFLDEPTSGLDPVNARLMKDMILELKAKGVTVFLTTHNMHDADELCDTVAFMVDGRLELIDAPGALKQKYGRAVVTVENENGPADFPLHGIGANQDFIAALNSAGLKTIHTQETTIEDVFIRLTGHSLV